MATIAALLQELLNQKNALANNLVTKGVSASTDEKLNTLVPKVLSIESSGGGIDTSDATATSHDILSGETAYVNGVKITGDIESKTSETYVPGLSNKIISAGVYLSGDQVVMGDPDLLPQNIKKGIIIFDVVGTCENLDTSDATATAADIKQGLTAYANGEKITGTAYTRGAVTAVVDGTQHWLQEGFYNGGITIPGDKNLIASNIKKGVTIYGTTGTFEGGSSSSQILFECDLNALADDIVTQYSALIKANNEGTLADLGPYVYNTMCATTYTDNNAGFLSGLSFKNESDVGNNGFLFNTPVSITSTTTLISLVYYISTWITPTLSFHLIQADSIDLVPNKIQNKDFVYSREATISWSNNTTVAEGEKKKVFFEIKAAIGEYYLYIEIPKTGGNDACFNRIEILNV